MYVSIVHVFAPNIRRFFALLECRVATTRTFIALEQLPNKSAKARTTNQWLTDVCLPAVVPSKSKRLHSSHKIIIRKLTQIEKPKFTFSW
jgi:hypothetical protein